MLSVQLIFIIQYSTVTLFKIINYAMRLEVVTRVFIDYTPERTTTKLSTNIS